MWILEKKLIFFCPNKIKHQKLSRPDQLLILFLWSLYSVAQLCPTLCDPMDCTPPDSSVHGNFPARILKYVAISSLRGSSWPRDRTCVSWIAGGCCYQLERQMSTYTSEKHHKLVERIRRLTVKSSVFFSSTRSFVQPNTYLKFLLIAHDNFGRWGCSGKIKISWLYAFTF